MFTSKFSYVFVTLCSSIGFNFLEFFFLLQDTIIVNTIINHINILQYAPIIREGFMNVESKYCDFKQIEKHIFSRYAFGSLETKDIKLVRENLVAFAWYHDH